MARLTTKSHIYRTWLTIAVVATILFVIGHNWIPIPFGFWDLWVQHGSIMSGLQSVWLVFVWGIGLTLVLEIVAIIRRKPRSATPSDIFVAGLWASVHAGVFEEIVYRFFRFILGMFLLLVGNFITFGLVGWIYTWWLIPLADWATFGLLSPQLTGAPLWIIAGAVISANGLFKAHHAYLGPIGYINSWYVGMIFFYLMFNYGLWTAIVAHIVYNLCVFTTSAVGALFRPDDSTEALVNALIKSLGIR